MSACRHPAALVGGGDAPSLQFQGKPYRPESRISISLAPHLSRLPVILVFVIIRAMKRYDFVFLLLAAIFLGSLIIANALAFKFVELPVPLVGPLTISVGLLPYPITFLATDLVSELYGKRHANALVFVGFLLSIYFLFFIKVGQAIPVSPHFDPAIQNDYTAVFGQSSRAIFGSMTAYLLAQFLDVRIFHMIKHVTGGKLLWLRNNGSTLISQLVDTIAVVTILFYDDPTKNIPMLVLSGYVYKVLVALADTPFFYAGVYLFRDIEVETKRRNAADFEAIAARIS